MNAILVLTAHNSATEIVYNTLLLIRHHYVVWSVVGIFSIVIGIALHLSFEGEAYGGTLADGSPNHLLVSDCMDTYVSNERCFLA